LFQTLNHGIITPLERSIPAGYDHFAILLEPKLSQMSVLSLRVWNFKRNNYLAATFDIFL